MNLSALVWLALIPLATGPLPAEERSLVVALCSGGTISIPLGDSSDEQPDAPPCPQQGCHAGTCRKRI